LLEQWLNYIAKHSCLYQSPLVEAFLEHSEWNYEAMKSQTVASCQYNINKLSGAQKVVSREQTWLEWAKSGMKNEEQIRNDKFGKHAPTFLKAVEEFPKAELKEKQD